MHTVLHETLSKQGAVFASHPSGPGVESFGDPAREAAAALAGSIIAPRSLPGRVVVRGKDHRDLLQRISTNEINALKAGDGCLTAFLDPRGRIIDLVQALADEDSVLPRRIGMVSVEKKSSPTVSMWASCARKNSRAAG